MDNFFATIEGFIQKIYEMILEIIAIFQGNEPAEGEGTEA